VVEFRSLFGAAMSEQFRANALETLLEQVQAITESLISGQARAVFREVTTNRRTALV
jgi:hypothetical protein